MQSDGGACPHTCDWPRDTKVGNTNFDEYATLIGLLFSFS